MVRGVPGPPQGDGVVLGSTILPLLPLFFFFVGVKSRYHEVCSDDACRGVDLESGSRVGHRLPGSELTLKIMMSSFTYHPLLLVEDRDHNVDKSVDSSVLKVRRL